MNLHSLFLLMGVTINHGQFAQALVALHGLHTMANMVGSAISGMAHELVDMAVSAAHSGTHLMGLSAGLGLSLKSVQEWSYVAEQAGTNADAFARGLGMFERQLVRFSHGGGSAEFKLGMAQVGISAQQARQILAGPDGLNNALFKVSDHYKQMGTDGARAGLNMLLFGARNREMAHDLGRGSEVLKEQIDRVHEIGGVLGDKQIDDLKKVDNSIKQIGTSFKALGMAVVADLAPQLIEMLNKVTAWIGANRQVISNVLMGLFQALAVVFKTLFAFVRLFVAAMDGDAGAIAVVSLLAAAFIGLAIILGMMIMPLISGLIAAFTALDIAMLPALGIFALIAIAIAGIILLITHWSEVVDFLKDNWIELLAVLMPFIGIPLLLIKHWDKVKEWFSGFLGWFHDKMYHLGERIVGFFKGLGQGVVTALKQVANLFLAPLEAVINKAIGMLNHLPGVSLSKVSMTLDTASSPAKPTLTPAAVSAFHAVGGAGQEGATPLSGTRSRSPSASVGRATGTTQHVSIGPTTINIHGVKGAEEIKDHIGDHVDNVHRHAAAGLAGETQ